MPIEIGELEINAHIEGNADSGIGRNDPPDNEEIIREAVERVLEILRRKAAF